MTVDRYRPGWAMSYAAQPTRDQKNGKYKNHFLKIKIYAKLKEKGMKDNLVGPF